MFLDTNVSPARAWNTLVGSPRRARLPAARRSDRPGALFRQDGARDDDPAPEEIRFGRHALRGEAIDFETLYADTRLAFRTEKPEPFVVRGTVEPIELGEWGLRYWLTLCLSAEDGSTVEVDPETGAALVGVDHRFVALLGSDAPALTTGHESVAALVEDFDRNGYFDKSARSAAASLIALRFNFEMTPRLRFAAAVADSRALAIDRARAALADGERAEAPALQTGRHAGALDAVRDVIGWNTVYDRGNRRVVTAASRIWGLGDAVWYNDQCFAALMAGLLDPALGRTISTWR